MFSALQTFQFDPIKKDADDDFGTQLTTVNAVFTGLYTLEFLLKLCAFGKVCPPVKPTSHSSNQLVAAEIQLVGGHE